MMNWKKFYDEKISTPEEAIKDIHDGDCVVMGHAAAAPKIIQHAMAEHCEDYNDVLIFHMTTLGDNECLHPRCYGHFRHVSNFLAANSRDAVNHLAGDFFPAYFKDVPEMIGDEIPCEIAAFQATPPNEEGYCSLGVSCDYAPAAIRRARSVIIEINDQMPFVYGNTMIHVSQIDRIIPCSYQLPELHAAKPSEVEIAIGKYCSTLVADGSTLQLGIGAIPNAVLSSLGDK
ncbi:4-hydroxybutyrate CoA-transferase, partial [bacterium]|nr:4-hydroxybutyrate CoA-transferase [bacterium]